MIAVIDFGSQYTQLIARRIREQNVYSEIFPHTYTARDLRKKNIQAVILSGGPSSVYTANAPQIDLDILKLEVPILGICYGMQLLIKNSGGRVRNKGQGEYGFSEINKLEESILLKNITNPSKVWMSHGDEVDNLGNRYKIIAR